MDSDQRYSCNIRTKSVVGHWVETFSKSVRDDHWTIWHRKNPSYRCHARHSTDNPGVLHITNFYEDRIVGRLLVRVKAQTTIRGAGE